MKSCSKTISPPPQKRYHSVRSEEPYPCARAERARLPAARGPWSRRVPGGQHLQHALGFLLGATARRHPRQCALGADRAARANVSPRSSKAAHERGIPGSGPQPHRECGGARFFYETFDRWTASFREEAISPVLNKCRAFTTAPPDAGRDRPEPLWIQFPMDDGPAKSAPLQSSEGIHRRRQLPITRGRSSSFRKSSRRYRARTSPKPNGCPTSSTARKPTISSGISSLSSMRPVNTG